MSAIVRRTPAKFSPTLVFDSYWRFAHRRQEIYFGRVAGEGPPWTDDEVLSNYRFTNVFRAADRVSQYLIRRVIYHDAWSSDSPDDILFRVLLFKIFNRIGTWELIEDRLGPIAADSFDPCRYAEVLEQELRDRRPIYSAAYIMPSPRKFGFRRKHENHLALLRKMLCDGVGARLAEVSSMGQAFRLLRSYPGLGDFLAYQFLIDINYSELTDFSENEFVMPGPGATEGIRKAFSDTGGLGDADVIRMVTESQEFHFDRLGLPFRTLFGRPLQLIDCQNLFCEVAKYSRVAHPSFTPPEGRKRIKQRYAPRQAGLPEPWFPPKWGLNGSVSRIFDERGSRGFG